MKSTVSSHRWIIVGGLIMLPVMARIAQAAVPAEMVGNWRWTTISGTDYVDKSTGQITGNAGGMSVGFTFNKNGRYKFNFFVRQKTYSLVTEAFTTHEGTVTFAGNKIILKPEKGHYRGSSTGGQKVDRPMTAAERQKNNVYYYKWETRDGQKQLLMGPSQDSLSTFKREG